MQDAQKTPLVLAFGATALVGVALKRRNDVTVVHCVAPAEQGNSTERSLTVRVEDAAEVAALVERLRPKGGFSCHAVWGVGPWGEDPAGAPESNVGGGPNLPAAASR